MPSISAGTVVLLTLLLPSPLATAQDAAFEAWSRVFDAIRPGWNDPTADIDPTTAALGPDDLNIISEYASGPARPPTAVERAALARLESIAPLFADATSHRTFDAGVDWDQGFAALLPHLGLMRESARCLRALAHRAAADGDAEAAAAWTGRVGTLAGQAAQDGTLIGSMVGGVIYLTADRDLDAFFGSGMLDRETAAAMLEGMGWLGDTADPFRFTDAMVHEREIMAMELDRLAARLDAGDPEAATFLEQLFTGESGAFGDLDGEAVRGQAAMMFDLQTRMIDAAADPDRARGLEAMRAIEAEVNGLEDMALVRGLIPSLGSVLETRLQIEGQLEDRLRILQAIADGRLDPSNLSNAAILWDRLGTIFETLPGSVQIAGLALLDALPDHARIDLLVSRAVGEPGGDLRTSDDGRRVIDPITADPVGVWWHGLAAQETEIHELAVLAAALPTANFPISPGIRPQPEVESDELARLRGAGRGLVADAWSRLRAVSSEPAAPNDPVVPPRAIDRARELAAATDEIVATLALIHDLVADPALVHIVMAGDLVRSVDDLLRSDVAAAMLRDPDHRDRITAAITAVPRPIMLDAGAAARADLQLFATHHARRWPTEPRTRLLERVRNMSPDRAYAILAEARNLRVVSREGEDDSPPTPLTPWAEPDDDATGYRPLRLLASLEGMHGRDRVLTRLEPELHAEHPNRVIAAFAEAARETSIAMPVLDSIVIPDRHPLELQAMETLNLIAGLDRLVREMGRADPPATAR